MKYSNRQVPEGINTSAGSPLKTFFKLLAAILVVLIIAAWLLGKSGAWLATLIPIEKEMLLAGEMEIVEFKESATQQYLARLARELAEHMEIPSQYRIKVYYDEEPVINAFATLGGHVIFYKGLIKQLNSENALAMLIAHELAHVKHRDPIASLGQGIAISTGFELILGKVDIGILGNTGLYTQLKFSRDMESAADEEALAAVYRNYGHLAGALDLYEVFLDAQDEDIKFFPAFLATHPLTAKRIENLRSLAKDNNWPLEGKKTALPNGFAD